jgi:hypothetical protein
MIEVKFVVSPIEDKVLFNIKKDNEIVEARYLNENIFNNLKRLQAYIKLKVKKFLTDEKDLTLTISGK